MAKAKKPLFFALSLLPVAVIGAIATVFYQIDVYGDEIIDAALAELGSIGALIAISTAQTVLYALVCGFFGYIFSNKVGLWKPFRAEKKSLLITLTVSLAGGIIFSLDYWVFGSVIEGIREAVPASLTFKAMLAFVLYGGIIEEVMLRLFFMSLLALIIRKLFCAKRERADIPAAVFIAANIIAALLFAAGHLPATVITFGQLTPLLLLRCFLLNGGFGLMFGRLYRKYGIVYAMLSHALLHIVSKLIWLIFT